MPRRTGWNLRSGSEGTEGRLALCRTGQRKEALGLEYALMASPVASQELPDGLRLDMRLLSELLDMIWDQIAA